MRIYFDRRDWWLGYYRGDTHHYVCPLPTVVIRWRRAAQTDGPNVDFKPDWGCEFIGGPFAGMTWGAATDVTVYRWDDQAEGYVADGAER